MSDYIAGALDAICCVHGLFTDVILPAFDGYRLDGMLQQQTGGGQRERATAALDWMQRHYDSLPRSHVKRCGGLFVCLDGSILAG